MAIGIGASAGAGGATSVSLNIGSAGNDRLVVVIIGLEGTTHSITDVTVDGKSCTALHQIINTNSAGNVQQMWYILEAALGASNGSVTVAMVGGSTSWGIACQVYTGVNQAVPKDSNYNDTELTGPTIPVTSIDVSANGLVVAGYGQGQGSLTATYTSPLVERQSIDPTSADLYLASALESSGQSAKTYTATCSATYNRATGIVASWDEAGGVAVSDVDTDEDIDDEETGIVVTGTGFEASQGSGNVEIGDDADYATASKVSQVETSWGDLSITITVDLGAQSPGGKWLFVTNNTGLRNDPGFAITVHRAHAVRMIASGNIAASGENTTVQLTAPSGKTTGDFDAGRIQDDENPADAVNVDADDYTEMEWCIEAKTGAREVAYSFRVTIGGTVLDTYTVTPQMTVSAGQTIAIGMVTETDLAQAMTKAKMKGIVQVVETNLAQAISAVKTRAIGQVVETDLAQALSRLKTVGVGLVNETDLAQPVTWNPMNRLIIQVVETDLSQVVTPAKSRVVGQVTETDLAQSVAWAPMRRLIGMVTETDLAQAVVWAPKIRLIGMVTETDLAQAVTKALIVAVGQVAEVDLAQPVSWNPMARLVNQVTEVDVAQPVSWSPMHRLVGQVVETNLAQPFASLKTKLIGQVVETDQALGVAWAPIHRLILMVSETDSVWPITTVGQTIIAVAMVTETDLAQIIAYIPKIQQVVETDLAQPVQWSPITRLVGQVEEADEALRMVAVGGKPSKPWMNLQRRGLRGR